MPVELWDAYDIHRRPTGKTLTRGEPVPKGLYHLGVHIWYISPDGKLLIQRRALCKKAAPGMWACSGGSALQGESSLDALMRESEEELGITPDLEKSILIDSYLSVDDFTDVYLVPFSGRAEDLRLQESEVMDAKWVTLAEMRALAKQPDVFWNYRYLETMLRTVEDLRGVLYR